MLPILREMDVYCLFFATGGSLEQTPCMLWYEELYLMLLDVAEPIALNLPEAGICSGVNAPSGKHRFWWNLVETLSEFDARSRRGFLDQIRSQLKLPEDWREQFVLNSKLAPRFSTLNLTGLRQLVAAGMTIGAHSISHPVLAKASSEQAWREISESRTILENALGQSVWAFGYPFGTGATVTQRDKRMAKKSGFQYAFMNVGGGFGAELQRFALPRVHVTAVMELSEFEAHISGFYRFLRERLLSES